MTGASGRRPNVLFVICDQLRADHLGFAGKPVVQTPNIDALAARGTVFDRAYVNNPVCMPNRSTLMTGRMPSAHGVIFNDRSLPLNATTFVGRLRDEGWSTALIGKSHLRHGESSDAVAPLGIAGASSPFPEGWDTLEHPTRYLDGEPSEVTDFYGFDTAEFTVGHGLFYAGHNHRWAVDRGADPDVLRNGLNPHVSSAGRSPLWWQIQAMPIPEEASATNFVTERTIDFIERSDASGEPWMAWCSFPDPHHPMAAPEPWFSRHHPDEIDLPSTFDDSGDDWPVYLQRTRRRGVDDPFFQTGQRNIGVLRRRVPSPHFFVHPDDAATEGLVDGEWACLETAQGEVRMKVSIQDSIRQGHIRVPHGWWYPETRGEVDLAGAFVSSDAVLTVDTDDVLDYEQGIPHFKGYPGKISPCAPPEGMSAMTLGAD